MHAAIGRMAKSSQAIRYFTDLDAAWADGGRHQYHGGDDVLYRTWQGMPREQNQRATRVVNVCQLFCPLPALFRHDVLP